MAARAYGVPVPNASCALEHITWTASNTLVPILAVHVRVVLTDNNIQ